MSSLSQSYIQDKFAEYYKQQSAPIKGPSSFERREFGFLLLDKKVMMRHKSFRDVDALRSALVDVVPSDVYYSSAYYERPDEEMKAKGWLGADLVFDIDADHISTPCTTVHDIWVCTICGASGRGVNPQKCSCGGTKFKEKNWPCEICLEASKAEAIKLIDMLTADFGFSNDVLTVAFSGNRGYHIHVESKSVRELDSLARKEIVDYVTGTGLEADLHGLGKSSTPDKRITGPALDDRGWRGRIAKGTYGFLLDASKEELIQAGFKTSQIKTLLNYRETILGSWDKNGPWGAIKGITSETWKKIAESGVENQSAKIDTVVTPDVNRLIRLTGSLHGKTGLKKVELAISELEAFDPLEKAVAFKDGTVTVHVSDAPEFRVGDEIYGPFKRKTVEIPTAAALMLLCKGVAQVVQ